MYHSGERMYHSIGLIIAELKHGDSRQNVSRPFEKDTKFKILKVSVQYAFFLMDAHLQHQGHLHLASMRF